LRHESTQAPGWAPLPGPFQSLASSQPLPDRQTRLSPVSSAPGQHRQPVTAMACTTALLLRDLGDDAHQQSVVATSHQQGQALLRPHGLIHILCAARCLPVDLQHNVTCLQPCPAGRTTTGVHSRQSRRSALPSQKEGEAWAAAPGVPPPTQGPWPTGCQAWTRVTSWFLLQTDSSRASAVLEQNTRS